MTGTARLARAELRKLFTARAAPASIAIAAVLAVASVLIDAVVAGKSGAHALGSTAETYQMLKLGGLSAVVMLIIGILAAGGEFRHRTIVPTLLATPDRTWLFVVKVAVVTVFGAVFSAVIFGLGLGTVAGTLAAHGIHHLPAQTGRLYFGSVIAGACFGMIGAALGALTRNTVGAIVAAIAWAIFVEQIILQAVAPSLEKWLPVGASLGLTNPPSASVLPPALAGLVLIGYAAVLLIAASTSTIRRDVG